MNCRRHNPLIYAKVIFVLAFPAVAVPVLFAGADDPCLSLKDLPHNVGFVFIQRGTCQAGQSRSTKCFSAN